MTPYFLTATGGRSEALALTARWLDAQSYRGPAQWVICDDCVPASPVPRSRFDVRVIWPPWRWQPGMNTQARSMAALLERVPDDATVIIVEDDDCYLPQHVSNLLAELESYDLVGEKTSRYFNIKTMRWRLMPGKYHASLATVGVKGEALQTLREICARGSRRIDMDLWGQFAGPKTLLESAHVIGIKGLPGRAGIGVGHRDSFGTPDDGTVLREWLGDRATAYEQYRRHG
jgi:hypothetical protein